MIHVAHISREITERILFYSTALHDLHDDTIGSAYHNGEFLDAVERRRGEVKKNLEQRRSVTHTCRTWRRLGLKFRFEYLVIDAKCSEAWAHACETLTEMAEGRHVKRLELDAFDSNIARVKSAAGILKQCPNVRSLSLRFLDDSRKNLVVDELLLHSIRIANMSSMEHFSCNFGKTFEQESLAMVVSMFPTLRTVSIDSAFGTGPVSSLDTDILESGHLRDLKVTTTSGVLFRRMSDWTLSSLKNLSIFYLRPSKCKRFFRAHGFKLRSLELMHIKKGSDIASLLDCCPSLEELVMSVDGVSYSLKEGLYCAVSHSNVRRIGIRDISINSYRVRKTMAILEGLMRRFTSYTCFPYVLEIRLLDFHRALWHNVAWSTTHIDLWKTWVEKCEDMIIDLQAADGETLCIGPGSFRALDEKDDHWLSARSLKITSDFYVPT